VPPKLEENKIVMVPLIPKIPAALYKPKKEIEEQKQQKAWENYKTDSTFYSLTDRSDDSDSDIDANYDSLYFSNSSGEENYSQKGRTHTHRNKLIAKWAENKSNISLLLGYQQAHLNPDAIFGKLSSDTINLKEIFGKKSDCPEIRGSSANWKNEMWTPLLAEKPKRIDENDKTIAEKLDKKFILSQACGSLEEVLAKDEASPEKNDIEPDFSSEFLQMPPSFQDI